MTHQVTRWITIQTSINTAVQAAVKIREFLTEDMPDDVRHALIKDIEYTEKCITVLSSADKEALVRFGARFSAFRDFSAAIMPEEITSLYLESFPSISRSLS